MVIAQGIIRWLILMAAFFVLSVSIYPMTSKIANGATSPIPATWRTVIFSVAASAKAKAVGGDND